MISWLLANRPPPLETGEVHVWRPSQTVSKLQLAHWELLLPATELRAIRALSFPRKRSKLVGRGLRRELLGLYTDQRPNELIFSTNSYGKPLLEAPENSPPVYFNQSYTDKSTVLAVTKEGPLGVDIESWNSTDLKSMVNEVLSSNEVSEWAGLSEAEKVEGFFNAWTCKEAYLKALGTGLSFPLKGFSVQLSPKLPPRLLHCAYENNEAVRWRLSRWQIYTRHSFALATSFIPTRVRMFEYTSAMELMGD